MGFEIEGRLTVKKEVQVISEKFKKREFVILTENDAGGTIYTEDIKFQLVQDKCDIIESCSIGDNVKISFNIKGNKWEKDGKTNYFNNLDAWRIEKLSGSDSESTMGQTPPVDVIDDGESLPF